MGPDGPSIRDSAIEFDRQMFEKTKNPLYVWRALEFCCSLAHRGICDSFPDWITEYLASVAEGINQIYHQRGFSHLDTDPKVSATIVELLKFKDAGQGKRLNAFAAFQAEHEALMLAGEVRNYLRDTPGATEADAFVMVSENHAQEAQRIANLKATDDNEPEASPDKVERAYREWNDFLTKMRRRE